MVFGTPSANMLTGLGIDEVFSRTDPTGTRSFLTDALGSTVALTDDTGAVQTSYTYDPFGDPTASGASDANTQQYTGRESDGTGLQYNRARYYSPTMQRLISEDPLGFGAGDPNLYAYVGNDPINATDPSGMLSIRDLAGSIIRELMMPPSPMSGRKPSDTNSLLSAHSAVVLLDGTALALAFYAAFTTDVTTVAYCGIGFGVGCVVGYVGTVAEVQPMLKSFAALGYFSTGIGCAQAGIQDPGCNASAQTMEVGMVFKDPNIMFALDLVTFLRDIGVGQ